MRTTATSVASTASALVLALLVTAASPLAERELRVCADPNNLPFSNQKREGFENKLAELLAAELNATVKYTWVRQRRGFIRRTLNANACDVVTAVPNASEMVLVTKPYYRSSYVFVYRKGDNLQLRSFDDPVLRQLRIGLHAIGDDGANPPPVHALARRGLASNVFGFPMWDVDAVVNPQGKIIEAVAKGDIDVAIVWGPFGGYFAGQQKSELEVVPVTPSIGPAGIPFVYDISIGVRRGEVALKSELDRILDRRQRDVQKILQDYGIPVISDAASSSGDAPPAR